MTMNFHSASPILRVADLQASIDYFEKKLGFKLDWKHEDTFASVSRLACNIMLSQGDQGNGKAWVYVGIGDADRLFQEYQQRGANIRQRPTNFYWAYEMQVEDLDGNVIRLGSEPKQDVPFGPWLDMHGKPWG